MSQDDFWTELSKTTRWFRDGNGLIRQMTRIGLKIIYICPICAVANLRTHIRPYECEFDLAAESMMLDAKFADTVARASDNIYDDRSIRDKIIEACRL